MITLSSEQVKPARERGAVLDTADDLIGLGTLDDRLLIPEDLEKRVTGDDMGLVEKKQRRQCSLCKLKLTE